MLRQIAGTAVALAMIVAGPANAATLVGSWRVTDGPAVGSALSAQEAAAQLFGGDAANYVISTNPGAVNHQAWYVIIGAPGGATITDEYATDVAGSPISAYRFDGGLAAEADRFTNYAFSEMGPGIPEPATWLLMIGGFALSGAALRRRRLAA